MRKINVHIAMCVAVIGGLALPVTDAYAFSAPPITLSLCVYRGHNTVCFSSMISVTRHDEICALQEIGTEEQVAVGGGVVYYPYAAGVISGEYGCDNYVQLSSGYSGGFDCCAPIGQYRHSNNRYLVWDDFPNKWGNAINQNIHESRKLTVVISNCGGPME